MADIFNMVDEWTSSGTTYNAIKMNVTDTASASGSLLMDLQVGGTSKFNVTKAGSANLIASGTNAGLLLKRDSAVQIQIEAGATVGHIGTVNNYPFRFLTNNSEAMRIDSSGKVGIGATSPDANLVVSSAGDTIIKVAPSSAGTARLNLAGTGGGAGAITSIENGLFLTTNDTGPVVVSTNGSEAMRIDSSGFMVIGATSQGSPDAVTISSGSGYVQARATSMASGYFDRNTTDGAITEFRKDGTAVGSIGVDNGDKIYIGSGDTGIYFNYGGNAVSPYDPTSGYSNNLISLGSSSVQWKDVHMAGTLYSGDGTAAAPSYTFGVDTNTGMFRPAADTLGFATLGIERMRLSSGGSWMLDTTTDVVGSSTQEGVYFNKPSGYLAVARNAGVAIYTNRQSSDGPVVGVRKDGVDQGFINAVSGDIAIGTGDTGVRFEDASNAVIPFHISNNADTDDTVDLGKSTVQFKDIHMAGTLYGGFVDLGTSSTAGQQILTYHSGNTKYGVGVVAGESRMFSPTGNTLTFGHVSTADGSTYSERMRIDSNGSVLVGTTVAGGEGITLHSSNYLWAVRDNAICAYLARQTSDGDIVEFRKNTTDVGSIGTISNDLTVGTGATRIRFDDGQNAITPRDASDASTDNQTDIGQAGGAFKDIHMAGTLYLDSNPVGGTEVTIADDAVASITPPRNGGFAFITGGSTDYPNETISGFIYYDCGLTLNIGEVSTTFVGANFDVVTTDVTGTSGTDTNVTVAVQSGVLKIENRAGATRDFQITFL